MAKEKSKKTGNIAPLLIVFGIFLLFGIFMRYVVFDAGSEDRDIKNTKITEESVSSAEKIMDGDDVAPEEAENYMVFTIEMPEEMKETIDMTAFQKAFEEFLIEEDLWSDELTATSDNILTENFKDGTKTMSFTLDDYAQTIVDVVSYSDGTFTFNYY
ncbi:MAG: hypothetical protein ACLU7V_06460 [Anaerovoracaceae bacterium]